MARWWLIFLLASHLAYSENKWALAASRTRRASPSHVTLPPSDDLVVVSDEDDADEQEWRVESPVHSESPLLMWAGGGDRPAVSKHPVLLSTLDGAVHALDPFNGDHLWTVPGMGPLVSSPSSHAPNQPLLVPSIDGSVFLHSGSSKDALQSLPMSVTDIVNASPLSGGDGTTLYVGSKDSQIIRVDAVTGDADLITSTTDLSCDGTETKYFLARVEHSVRVLDSQSGKQLYNLSWSEWADVSGSVFSFREALISGQPDPPLDDFFLPSITAGVDGWVHAWDTQLGEKLWSARITSPVVALHMGSSDGMVHKIPHYAPDGVGVYIGQWSGSLVALPGVHRPDSSSALVSVTPDCLDATGPCIPLLGLHETPARSDTNALVLHLPSIDPVEPPVVVTQPLVSMPLALGMIATSALVGALAWLLLHSPGKPSRRRKDGTLTLAGGLVVGEQVLGLGSHGTEVRQGLLGGRRIAVKRMLRRFYVLAKAEVALLLRADAHPNVVTYLNWAEDGDFVYLALELCPSTLEQAIESKRWSSQSHILRILNGIASGVAHLHSLKICHTDIKPANILLDSEDVPRISDMALGKQIDSDRSSFGTLGTGWGTVGWRAPEVLKGERKTRSVDMFSLGCVMYYVLTGGDHPFGEHPERDGRIYKNLPSLARLDSQPMAQRLIEVMISHDPEQRPSAEWVVQHPVFWSPDRRLSFLLDFSDRVEVEAVDAPIVVALDALGGTALGSASWDVHLGSDLLANLVCIAHSLSLVQGKYRKYNFESIRDLLRVIRNKRHHYRDLPESLQAELGQPPCGYLSYFEERFPRLFITVWEFAATHHLS